MVAEIFEKKELKIFNSKHFIKLFEKKKQEGGVVFFTFIAEIISRKKFFIDWFGIEIINKVFYEDKSRNFSFCILFRDLECEYVEIKETDEIIIKKQNEEILAVIKDIQNKEEKNINITKIDKILIYP